MIAAIFLSELRVDGAAELLQPPGLGRRLEPIAGLHDVPGERCKHERDNDEEKHPQEDLPERIQHRGAERARMLDEGVRRPAERQRKNRQRGVEGDGHDPGDDADNESKQDVVGEGAVLTLPGWCRTLPARGKAVQWELRGRGSARLTDRASHLHLAGQPHYEFPLDDAPP